MAKNACDHSFSGRFSKSYAEYHSLIGWERHPIGFNSKVHKSPCNNATEIKNRQDLLKEIGNNDRLSYSTQALLMKCTLDLEKMLGILCRLELKQAAMQNAEQIITNFIEFSIILKIIPEPSFQYMMHVTCSMSRWAIIPILSAPETFLKGSKNNRNWRKWFFRAISWCCEQQRVRWFENKNIRHCQLRSWSIRKRFPKYNLNRWWYRQPIRKHALFIYLKHPLQ